MIRTCLALLGAIFVALSASAQGLAKFDRAGLAIVDSAGQRHKFNVELALSPQQQAQGLMFRQQMAPDAGMLFVYRTPIEITMWMKNTFLPLDMVFVGPDRKVLRIAERTVPQSEATISSGGRAIGVIELNAGTAARLKLKPGDQVEAAALN